MSMKKSLKRTLWGVGILLGIIVIGAAVFIINFLIQTKKMTPSETGPINDSVWCVKDKFVNAFIFKGKIGYLMVDAGFGKNSFNLELKKLNIKPDQITTLLLTHTDGDHTGAVPLFKNIDIYMHRDEEQMINGINGKSKYFKTKWKYGPYKLLNNNDTLLIDGLKIVIYHSPGHTPGSCCYKIGNDYFITGDNLIVTDGKYEHFVEAFNMDTFRQIESMKSLPNPSYFKYILTSHYGVVKN
jgi:glyoxylase-like metal-dependent hydrolase (beta-lactamase superfamily II)